MMNLALKQILRFILTTFGGVSGLAFLRYIVFVISFKLKQNKRNQPIPPGPTPLPVIGSLLDVAKYPGPDGNSLVHIALMEMGKKYNGLFGLYLGANYTIVITKTSVAEEALCDHRLDNGDMCKGSNTTDRAPLQSHGGHHVPSMYIATRDGKGIAMSTGSYWRKVRGRLVAHITNPKVAAKNAPMIMEEVNSVCWSWRQRCARGESLTDLTAQLKRESMNMATRLLFSQRFGAELPEDYKTLQYCVEYIFANLSSGNPSDMIPSLRILPNSFLAEFQNVVKKRDVVLERIIQQHRKEFIELRKQGKMNDRSQSRDVCDLFLWDQIEGYDDVDLNGNVIREKLSEDQVTVCMWDILFASTDTTATTNEWMIYHLINNPDIQRKVHEELDRVIGSNRVPTYEDREKLPYFWAFIKEVFRYKLVSPIMVPHYAVEDMTLHDATVKEYFIPAGTAIFLHGYSMALDPEYWDEPEKFNPDRWFTKREEGLDIYGSGKRTCQEHYKFIPFSIGPRMCPGFSFAKVAQFLQAATIVHSFDFKLASNASQNFPNKVKKQQLDLTENWGLTIMPQRYGEMGLILAEPRPCARLMTPLYNDMDPTLSFLDRIEQKVKLIYRKQVSDEVALLRFGLGVGGSKVLGLPPGNRITVIHTSREQKRKETASAPINSNSDLGYFDLLVRTSSLFPDELGKLELGDDIAITGPWGFNEYLGKSQFKFGDRLVKKKFVGMVTEESGVPIMLQILLAALEDKEDTTKFSMIYVKLEKYSFCQEILEDLQERFLSRFQLHYQISTTCDWKIDEQIIASHLPPKGQDTIILLSSVYKNNVDKIGYPNDECVVI